MDKNMVKKIVLFISLALPLFGAENVYERNCVPCHQVLPTSLQQMFKRYLLIYSGEKNVKASIRHYLIYPSKSISVMSDLFIDSYGIKKKSLLNQKELDQAIHIYWEKYKVFHKLK
jgi:hypothetical protein